MAEPINEEQKIKRARKLTEMGDKIMLSRHKVTFYQNARNEIKEIISENEEAASLDEELIRKINNATAGITIEAYEQALTMMNHAADADAFQSAASAFDRAGESRKTNSVNEETLDPEIRKRFDETDCAEAQAIVCRKNSAGRFNLQRLRAAGLVAAAGVLVFGLALGFRTSTFRRTLGSLQLKIGMTDSAVKNLEKAYKRHKGEETYALYVQALYAQGCKSLKKEETEKAISQLQIPAEEEYEDADSLLTEAEMSLIKEAAVDDEVTFSGVKWKVLDNSGDAILLIREEGIKAGPYQDDLTEGTTWAESDLREYLNTTYFDEEFTDCEEVYILKTEIENPDNAAYGTDGGENTTDKVYLLSGEEYIQYNEYINDCKRSCWLRSSGGEKGNAEYVDVSRTVMSFGYPEDTEAFYVKPVIRLQIK